MIDDIVEGAAKGIIRFILEILFRILVEFFLFYTGEILLFFLTLGKKKPRWNYYSDEKASRWVIFTEVSVWLGFTFWLFSIWFVNNKIFI